MADPALLEKLRRARGLQPETDSAPPAVQGDSVLLEKLRRARGSTGRAPENAPSVIQGELAGEKVLEALPFADRYAEAKFRRDVKAIEDREVRRDVRESAKFSTDKLKDVRSAANRAIYLARRRGDHELADRLKAELKASRDKAPPEPSKIGEAAREGGRLLFKALDAPHHAVRQLTTKAFGDNEHGLYDRDISAEEWTENVRKAEAQGGTKGTLASAALALPRAVGATAGTAIGAVTAGVGALSDVPSVLRGEKTGADVWENTKKTIDETQKDTTDLALTMATDPLSFVSFGASGAAKTAGGATLRAATKAGLARESAEQLANTVAKVAQRAAGTAKPQKALGNIFERAFTRAGMEPGLGRKVAAETFGEGAEFFGRSQLDVHLPFMSGRSVPLGAITGTDYAVGKAAKKVADPLLAKAGRRPLFDQEPMIAKALSREARGRAAIREAASNEDLVQKLAELPEGHRLNDPAVRKAILERHIDPAFEHVPIEQLPQEEALEAIRNNWLREKDGVNYALRPKDFVPTEQLDEAFGPGASRYVERTADWYKQHADELIEAGALRPEQLAANPISGRYAQRIFEPNVGALEDVVAKNFRTSGSGSSSMQSARVDKGYLSPDYAEKAGFAKRETDFLKTAPQYSRQSARAQTKAEFERRIVQQFGIKDPGPGANSQLNRRIAKVEVDGKSHYLPADIANIMHGTFDQGLTTLARAARTNGLDATPMGRALIHVLETYGKAAQRFKGLVLKTPAYHAVNLTDDLVKMMSAGMKDPVRKLRQAGELMSKGEINLRGRRITLAEANRENIGVDAAVRFENQGAKETERAFREALDQRGTGKSRLAVQARRGYEKVDSFSNQVGEAWENRAKIAMWLHRLEAGDSPAIAARRAFDVLIDYGDRSRVDHMLGWFVPFIKFAKESPGVVGKLAGRNPGALNALDRGLELFGGEGHAPPKHITERGRYVQLTPRGQEVAGQFRELAGGSRAKKGLSMGFVPRLTVYEGLTPYIEAARGNVDPLIGMLGPLQKAVAEYATEKDLLTKQPMRRPDSPLDLFPAGTPGVPTWAQADAGTNQEPPEIPWASRYIPSYVASPLWWMAANRGVNAAQGGTGAISTFGGHRRYTGRGSPDDIYAQQAMKFAVGHPVYETTPADALNTLAELPEIQAALANIAAQKRSEKVEKKARRREARQARQP